MQLLIVFLLCYQLAAYEDVPASWEDETQPQARQLSGRRRWGIGSWGARRRYSPAPYSPSPSVYYPPYPSPSWTGPRRRRSSVPRRRRTLPSHVGAHVPLGLGSPAPVRPGPVKRVDVPGGILRVPAVAGVASEVVVEVPGGFVEILLLKLVDEPAVAKGVDDVDELDELPAFLPGSPAPVVVPLPGGVLEPPVGKPGATNPAAPSPTATSGSPAPVVVPLPGAGGVLVPPVPKPGATNPAAPSPTATSGSPAPVVVPLPGAGGVLVPPVGKPGATNPAAPSPTATPGFLMPRVEAPTQDDGYLILHVPGGVVVVPGRPNVPDQVVPVPGKEVYIKKKQEKKPPPIFDVDTEEASDDSSDGGHGYGYGHGRNSNQNQAGWRPVSSALATDQSRWPGKEGRCEVVGPCVQSSNFPSAYADNDSCEVFFSRYPSYVRVQAFATRDEGSSAYSDRLRVSGKEYKGAQLTEGRGLLVNGNISWRAASSAVGNTTGYGWQVCVTELASCADGLPLEPVPLTECPGVLEFIPSCDFVEPGELCEGMLDMGAEGSPETPICGTRNDLGNCPSRSVYRKSMPTTTSTSIAVTTPSFEFTDSPVGLWQHAGPCEVRDGCLHSPNFPAAYGVNESCVASVPNFFVVKVVSFATERYEDFLTVSGRSYSGPQWLGPQLVVVHSPIFWHSGSTAADSDRGWELCIEDLPSCADGLALMPVSIPDCPLGAQALPDCQKAAPGEICEGDGSCGTRTDIDNCYDGSFTHPPTRDVYRKNEAANETMQQQHTTVNFTSATTTTFGDHGAPWQHAGPCEVRDGCLRSPNFPAAYGVNESCVASVPNFFVVKVVSFATERYEDFLTVSGRSYSGPQWLGPQLVVVHSPIFWHSGSTAADSDRGWELCIEDLLSCADGLALMPVSIPDCPLGAQALPDCQKAAPGEICEGDGSCGTRTDIDNCYDSSFTHPPTRDVYMKFDGSTLTTTTLTGTRTTTQTTSTLPQVLMQTGLWDHSGPCAIDSESGLECVGPPSDKMQSGFECFFRASEQQHSNCNQNQCTVRP